MKKFVTAVLSASLVLGTMAVAPACAADNNKTTVSSGEISFDTTKALYVHGVINSGDTEAWQAWQSEHDEDFKEVNADVKYFFLPTSADSSKADVYNAYSQAVTVNGVEIASGETKQISYESGKDYSVTADNKTYTLRFMKSNAEAGIYVNNSNADGNGTDLMSYLNEDKSLSAKATGAIVSPDGSIDNTTIKKIKGRGNTTWDKPKKAYNITYDENVVIGGMKKSKKYSILANYQDDSLSRNRFLYDLSDAVGMPYASDSRYVDFYVNGFYWGSYQMTEKIEVGKNTLMPDIDDKAYINKDGTINEDFPFVCEVDASAKEGEDYFVTCNGSTKVTIKAPELNEGDPGYEEVKAYVKLKYNNFLAAIKSKAKDISPYADVDSIAKLYLINELGKNWDSGVSSLYLTWKQDAEGNYKFYGSPVWDYDNSLGNAVGVGYELRSIGVDDYEEYTGWWCMYKGKTSGTRTNNIMNCASVNTSVQSVVPRIWFEDFVPALNDFSGKTHRGLMKSFDEYYSLISDSAEMNYKSGWLLDTGNWIADHSSMKPAVFDNTTHKMVTGSMKTYRFNFKGMFDYTVDWMNSRSAWLSEQYYSSYTPSYIIGDADLNGEVNIDDVTAIQRYSADMEEFSKTQKFVSDVNCDGVVDINDATVIQKYLANMIESLD